MPAPITIQASVRTMLIVMVAVADAKITHGYRLQDTNLPAITYECTQEELQSIGSSPLLMASVTSRIIARTTQAALDQIPYVKAVCVTGTFSSLTFDELIERLARDTSQFCQLRHGWYVITHREAFLMPLEGYLDLYD